MMKKTHKKLDCCPKELKRNNEIKGIIPKMRNDCHEPRI